MVKYTSNGIMVFIPCNTVLVYVPCEYILRRVGFELEKGIKVGGRTINNLRYADDTTILAEDKGGLKKLLKKTKIMTTGTLNKFILDGTEIEIVNGYSFLGTIITRDGYDHKK
jgi:hypothetical protein